VNRESKRMMERKGRSDADGSDADAFDEDELAAVAVASGPASSRSARRAPRQRTTPMIFARQIRDELRQVAWPTRVEMVNYSTIVLVTLIVMTALIFLLNFAFGKGVLFMFQK
jgi:preprotein translocase subunit SecE